MLDDRIEDLYIKYYRVLYLYAFALCKNHHLAQDLASDTFLRACLSLPDGAYIKYWLFRVCKNLYIDSLKKNKEDSSGDRVLEIIDDFNTPIEWVIQSEENKKLYTMIMNLNESYREVLVLYYFSNLSIGEISQSKGITVGATKTLLFRARKKLKKEMGDRYEL